MVAAVSIVAAQIAVLAVAGAVELLVLVSVDRVLLFVAQRVV